MNIHAGDLISRLEGLVRGFSEKLNQAESLQALEDVRIEFMGRKGALAEIMSMVPKLAPEDRPEFGRKANLAKEELNKLFSGRESALNSAVRDKALAEFDHSMPGRTPWAGSLHPITLVMREICDVFTGLGFDVVLGPEIETDYYNFEALNIPPDHPARDMQDTLYITENILLRTHTSPLQIRTMKEKKPPLAAIAPGKVYRRDSDLTHTPMFHQIEGFMVDRKVSMADLRGILTVFSRAIFGEKTKVRFRPSFFPFTEPSAEVDISCCMCGGSGENKGMPCRVCKQTGWVEVLGCGMIDPAVFASVGYPEGAYTGFAFGLGVERVAMLKYGIGDLRMFFENDTRFLTQFN